MLGLFVDKLFGNETLIHKLQDKPACVFYINPSAPIINNNLPTFQAHEVNGFKYPIMATDINTSYYLTKATYNNQIMYYLRGLDWFKKDDYYENQINNFTNPKIYYVSASEFIQKELEMCWGTSSVVIPEIEFEKVYELPIFK